jgi:hypothetical protein
LTADVQSWFNTPASNFGWVIVGAEGSGGGTAKRFDTRENANPPVLTISYTPPTGSVQPVSAVSRKMHGGPTPFDIDLLAASPQTECRSGGPGGNYQVVVTFARAVSVGGVSVTSRDGLATASASASSAVVTIDLAQVANIQTAMITLLNVNDGLNTSNVAIPLRVLVGDATGNGSVTASDIGQVKAHSGQAVGPATFRSDVTANGGSITASDLGLVKAAAGTQLQYSPLRSSGAGLRTRLVLTPKQDEPRPGGEVQILARAAMRGRARHGLTAAKFAAHCRLW